MARQGSNMTGDVATAEKQCKNWRGRHFWENSQEKQAQAFFGTRKRHEKERKQKLNDIGSRPPINPVVEALPRSPPPKKNLTRADYVCGKKNKLCRSLAPAVPVFFVFCSVILGSRSFFNIILGKAITMAGRAARERRPVQQKIVL